MLDSRPTRLGNFELIARIAKGGMAEIYLARQVGAGFSRLVVVKRILPHLAEERHFVEMFLEEARLAALIRHANVVQIFDVGECEGEYYIAMEYIDGPTVGRLARHARDMETPVPIEIAATIMVQACHGLHAAHELQDETGQSLQLVHRDISPHNLMLSCDGIVKLVDFGVAKAQNTAIQTHTGGLKGKFPYMSPEQCRGEPLDRRTDIFSLGIVFFELVTAQRLFSRASELLTLKAISEEAIEPARKLNPQLPEAFDRLITRALAKERKDRFSTAAELAEALQGALASTSIAPSSSLLANYLAEEFGDLIGARQAAVRRLASKPTGGTPPVVGDFVGDRLDSGTPGADTVATRNERGPVPRQSHEDSTLTLAPIVGEEPLSASGVASVFSDETQLKGAKAPPRRRLRWFSASVAAILFGTVLGLAYRNYYPPGPPLRFGMAPVYAVPSVERDLEPLMRYLRHRLKRKVVLVVTKNYRELRTQLLAGVVDFASLAPLQFVRAKAEYPALGALASSIKEGARTYQSFLLSKAGSGIRTVQQLRGRRICYVDRGSASGYLMVRHYLRSQGFDPNRDVTGHFSGTHSEVLKDLLAGKCEAGASNAEAHRNARRWGLRSSALQILAVTGELPNDMISPSPFLDAKTLRRLRTALLALDPLRDLGRPVIAETFPTSAFVAPRPEDYAPLAAADRAEVAAVGGSATSSPVD